MLMSGELAISDDLTITGPGASNLAVDGNHTSRVFYIGSRVTVTLSGLTIQNGSANSGGGIFNYFFATLTLTNSTVSGNSVLRFAGGIANYDNTTLTNSIVADQTSGGDCFNVSGVIASSGYNLDSDNTCNLTDPTDLPDGSANLGPLQIMAIPPSPTPCFLAATPLTLAIAAAVQSRPTSAG
jgi:hypothetical protein